jgi:K+-sensing histidine kinase KdpD
VRAGLEERIRATARYSQAQDTTFTVVSVRRRGLTEEDKTVLGTYAALTHQLQATSPPGRPRRGPALTRLIHESLATEVIPGRRHWPRWLHLGHDE